MANENKNINELVSDDDDPTVELEIPNFLQAGFADADVEQESDSHTYGYGNADAATAVDDKSIPELRSDLERRSKTIGRLQFDIEQLRARWLGLETEITAREEIVSRLNQDVDDLNAKYSRKNKLLKKRNKELASLKSEIDQLRESLASLEDQNSSLETQIAEQRETNAADVTTIEENAIELAELHTKLASVENELVTLKSDFAQQRSALEEQLSELLAVDTDKTAALEKSKHELQDLHAKFESAQNETASLKSDFEQERTELERQLAERAAADLETSTALEEGGLELEDLRSNLKAARNEIATLKSGIVQRDRTYDSLTQEHNELEQKLSALRTTDAKNVAALENATSDLVKLRAQHDATLKKTAAEILLAQETNKAIDKMAQDEIWRVEENADLLRFKLQDLTDAQTRVSNDNDRLNAALEQATNDNVRISDELDAAIRSSKKLKKSLKQQQKNHEQELRTLRFELGEAEDTTSQVGDLNLQLTSELLDTRSFKEGLENMLVEKQEDSKARIEELEERLDKMSHAAEKYEQKLDSKNSAINVLLGELAKKTEQLESIGEIEDVIQEIDDRMSERIDEPDNNTAPKADEKHTHGDHDRITRVLIGHVGDQELRFPLFKDRLTIGRTDENDIQLMANYISRRHALVVTEDDTTRIIDWGSKNGVSVNSKRVKDHVLSNGDIVSVGNLKFRYEERPKRDA